MKDKFSKEYIEFLEKNKILPLKEAADLLNLHPSTLRNFAKSNVVKTIKLGKKFYFNIEDIKNGNYVKPNLPDGCIVNNGHIKINVGRDFPSADNNGYIALHRLIMEANLLRRLNSNEIVIQKDNNTYNNQINNLEIQKNA